MIDYYQVEARKTAIYPKGYAVVYPALGLNGEASEVWGKLLPNKDGKKQQINAADLQPELGDVLWYITNTGMDADILLNDLAEDLTGGLAPTKFADLAFQLLDKKDRRSPYAKLTMGAGSVGETVKKCLRDYQGDIQPFTDRLRGNLGDTLRAWLEIHEHLKLDPDDTALANVLKLKSRQDRGKLGGDGDTR